ncbi:lipocalin family protein [Hugonella massiliensis]|uniref:lipocalin family protein n=1 Tax=Hugonella massiliensis TaxID=1720315 RepID=UPI00073EBB4B|nr:lipocalin family protein [Hugonella massiliensis]
METTKKMAGRIVLVCALALLCLGLFACSGSSADAKKAYIGQWKLTEMTENGEPVSADDMAMLDSLGMTIDLTVNEDGTFNLTFFGESQKGDWEAKSATEATFTVEGDSVPATLKDGKLTLSESDVSMTFEKKDDSNKG